MEQGPDFWCWFDTTQFSYHCVHPIHAKMFSIQMLLHFSQIVQRVCTLVLFINNCTTVHTQIVTDLLQWICDKVDVQIDDLPPEEKSKQAKVVIAESIHSAGWV